MILEKMDIARVNRGDAMHILWDKVDIQHRAVKKGYSITDEESKKVLLYLEENHDCNIGINWEVVDSAIFNMGLKKK